MLTPQVRWWSELARASNQCRASNSQTRASNNHNALQLNVIDILVHHGLTNSATKKGITIKFLFKYNSRAHVCNEEAVSSLVALHTFMKKNRKNISHITGH